MSGPNEGTVPTPPLPYREAKLARVWKAELTAGVVSIDGDKATLRLEGDLDLVYPYKGSPNDGKLTAPVAEVDVRGGELKAFTLASEEGRYVWYWVGKSPRSSSNSSDRSLIPRRGARSRSPSAVGPRGPCPDQQRQVDRESRTMYRTVSVDDPASR